MIILPNSPEMPLFTVEHTPVTALPGINESPLNVTEAEFSDFNADIREIVISTSDFFQFPELRPRSSEGCFAPVFGDGFSLNDLPPAVITNSYDDDDDDDDMDDVPDEEDDDIYEEVEQFEDFDDEFDEDFEDEFDEDYEDLARIDDEEIEGEDDDVSGISPRYEEEFGDVDIRTKFIPDGAEMGLNEEVLISEDDLEESDTSDFDDFEDDDAEEFNEYDN